LNVNHTLLASFDPYAVSKLLRYLFKYNDASEQAVEIYKSCSLLITKIIEERQRALINAKVDDPLIDIEVHDLVDMIRVYAAFASEATFVENGQAMAASVPPLFASSDPGEDAEADELLPFEGIPKNTDLGKMSIQLLKTLQGPILKKISTNRVVNVSEPSLANLADILFAYSAASPDMLLQDNNKELRVFVDRLEKTVQDKMILKDYFNTLSTTKIQWALAKYANKDLNPLYASDIAAAILPRTEHSVVKSVAHATYNEIANETVKKKKNIATNNLSLQLFAHATMDLHNTAFFETAFTNLKETGTIPKIEDLGYLAQAAAILKRPEYTALLIKWFDDVISDPAATMTDAKQVWKVNKQFSFC